MYRNHTQTIFGHCSASQETRGRGKVARKVLIEGSPSSGAGLAGRGESALIATVDEPRGGLVMIKARETAKNSLYYMGELLVTEAKVQVEGHIGLGIIAGDEPEAALELAIIDAAFNAGLEELAAWEPKLLEEEARMIAARAERSRAGRADPRRLRVDGQGVTAMRLDAVHDLQRVFRKILQATASPGTIVELAREAELLDLELPREQGNPSRRARALGRRDELLGPLDRPGGPGGRDRPYDLREGRGG